MKLWLVRHARPLVEPGICYGSSDVDADAAATLRAASALAARLPPAITVRGSPLRRCTQLADALAPLRRDLRWRLDARLAEMDFGAWEGRRWDDIGAAAVDAWARDFAHHRPGGGESVNLFMARVARAFDEDRAAGQDTAWITHAGVIRAATLLARGVRTLESATDWPPHAPPWGRWRLLRLNAGSPAPCAAAGSAPPAGSP